jgi:hypothetical protein
MKNVAIIFFLILLSGTIFSIINFYGTKEDIRLYKRQISDLEISNRLLKYSLFQTLIYSKDSIYSIIKTKNEIVPLLKIIDENTLVLRLSEHSCNPCLQRELANISALEKNGIPLLLIASYSNEREFISLLREYGVKSKYLVLGHDEELFSFEKNTSDLYLFLLTPDLNINYLFFPIQTEDHLSSEYYNFIETIFSEKRR